MSTNSSEISALSKQYQTLSLVLLCIATLQIALLCYARGRDVAGYELLAPAVGLAELQELGFLSAVTSLFTRVTDFGWWNPTHSILFTLPAGVLSLLVPSLWWAHLVQLFFWIAAWCMLSRSIKISFTLLLAINLCSPALQTHLLVGYPYTSGILPFLTAVAWLHSDLRRRIHDAFVRGTADLLFLVLNQGLAFLVYEMGKTWGAVLIAAALGMPWLSRGERSRLFFFGVLSAAHVAYFGRNNIDYIIADLGPSAFEIGDAIYRTFTQVFFSFSADSPVLVWLAVISLIGLGAKRRFYSLLLLSQLALLAYGNMQTDTLLFPKETLIPRRILILEGISALIIALRLSQSACHEAGLKGIARIVPPGLLIGAGIASALNINFLIDGPETRVLPYLNSPIDYVVRRPLIHAGEDLFNFIRETPGQHRILYEIDSVEENMGDPQGLPERLLLTTLYRDLKSRVALLTYRRCRFWCFPDWFVQPADRLWEYGKGAAPHYLHVFTPHPALEIFQELKAKGALTKVRSNGMFDSYLVMQPSVRRQLASMPDIPHAPHMRNGMCLQFYRPSAYPRLIINRQSLAPLAERFFLPESKGVALPAPLTVLMSSLLSNEHSSPQVIQLRIEGGDEVLVRINHRLLYSSGPGEHEDKLRIVEVELAPGVHALEITASNFKPTQLQVSLTGRVVSRCDATKAFETEYLNPVSKTDGGTLCIKNLVTLDSGISDRAKHLPILITADEPVAWTVEGVSRSSARLALFDVVHDDELRVRAGAQVILEPKDLRLYAMPRTTSALLFEGDVVSLQYQNLERKGIVRLDVTDAHGNPFPFECAH